MGAPTKDPDGQLAVGIWNMYYDIPNYRAKSFEIQGLSPATTWRSVGASANGFFTESFIDELIHAAGLDPLMARIKMCKIPIYRKLLETVGEMADWKGPLGGGKGRGVAFVESFGTAVAEIVEVTMTDAGIKIDKVWVAADVGKVVDPINFENLVQGGVGLNPVTIHFCNQPSGLISRCVLQKPLQCLKNALTRSPGLELIIGAAGVRSCPPTIPIPRGLSVHQATQRGKQIGLFKVFL